MTRLLIFFTPFLLSNQIVAAQYRDVKFKHITTENSLSHESINDIVQDYKGHIWITTSDGLNRYDGNTLKVYRNQYNNSNSLSFNWIWDLLPLVNGDLIIGTRKGLNIYSSKLDRFSKIVIDDSTKELNINQVSLIWSTPGNQQLSVKTDNECGQSELIFLNVTVQESATGLGNVSGNEVLIYPNPASDYLTIDYQNEFSQETTISLTDIAGNLVYINKIELKDQNEKFLIDKSNFNNGIYILSIQFTDRVITQKFIKNNFQMH